MRRKIDPEKIKLTPEEEAYEREADSYRPVSREEFLKIKEAITQWKKDTVLNMRINNGDLILIKEKAKKMGVRYQTFIAEILHRVAQS
jgi:predicted DNA binding CopG/RHH family protein